MIRLAALLLVLAMLAGCVSQGEFDATLQKLDAERANNAESRKLNEQITGDLIEARAVIRELREWIAAAAARLERKLMGGK